ncbi:MAG TPA: type II toxin-antitoxin system death-on-curing family toxin [Rhizobiaceae bacterium]|nr:type II toxin-antitoxin system death-on-curing family toxin [Rhizobiaceae bacterium]
MEREIHYLDMEDVLSIHARQTEQFGGSPGVRDAGLIEAALARPQSGYYADLVEEAAALWESLTMNHGFIDGNKRVGFAATYVFLRMNGLKIIADAREATTFVLGHLEAGTFTKDNLDTWLRANTRPAE